MSKSKPAVGAHRPYVPARAPLGKPANEPVWRVVVHRQLLQKWDELASRVGKANAEQLWDFLSRQPDRPSPYGCVSPMRGAPKGAKKTWHYEVSGAGRVDYQYEPAHIATPGKDPHPTVFIVGIDYGSH